MYFTSKKKSFLWANLLTFFAQSHVYVSWFLFNCTCTCILFYGKSESIFLHCDIIIGTTPLPLFRGLQSLGAFSCHTCYDTGHRFSRYQSKERPVFKKRLLRQELKTYSIPLRDSIFSCIEASGSYKFHIQQKFEFENEVYSWLKLCNWTHRPVFLAVNQISLGVYHIKDQCFSDETSLSFHPLWCKQI